MEIYCMRWTCPWAGLFQMNWVLPALEKPANCRERRYAQLDVLFRPWCKLIWALLIYLHPWSKKMSFKRFYFFLSVHSVQGVTKVESSRAEAQRLSKTYLLGFWKDYKGPSAGSALRTRGSGMSFFGLSSSDKYTGPDHGGHERRLLR